MLRLFAFLSATFAMAFAGGLSRADESAVYDRARLVAIGNAVVASEAPGIVRTLHCEAGDAVSRDQLLVALNQETYAAQYDVAVEESAIANAEAANEINLRYAEKSAEVNRKRFQRAQQARSAYAESITKTEVERMQLELEQAQLSGEQAETDLEIAAMNARLQSKRQQLAKVNLDSRQVKSPLGGLVAQVFVQEGEWVNAGAPIIRVIDPNRLRVQGYFKKEWMFKIRVGSEASFQYSIGGKNMEVPVEVSFVGSELVDGIFQVWADVDNENGKLISGLTGRLTIHVDYAKSANQ